MASNVYQQFFLCPTDSWHRRYEALRMVFLDRERYINGRLVGSLGFAMIGHDPTRPSRGTLPCCARRMRRASSSRTRHSPRLGQRCEVNSNR